MSQHPAFVNAKAIRDGLALAAWVNEERWWKYDPDFYNQLRAESETDEGMKGTK